jgi:polypeptide N-acetylgalactosaminyltransferase
LATAEVLVLLDAHCEVTVGWLEPMLARIKQNRKTVAIPLTGGIDPHDMKFTPGSTHSYGIFSWSLFFYWGTMPDRIKNRTRPMDPYPVPTMCGGLLAVEKKFFFEIGGYDDGMEVWGGENLEMSFRTWMCGGRVEHIPCSHVNLIKCKKKMFFIFFIFKGWSYISSGSSLQHDR